jgi:hypothetical protein
MTFHLTHLNSERERNPCGLCVENYISKSFQNVEAINLNSARWSIFFVIWLNGLHPFLSEGSPCYVAKICCILNDSTTYSLSPSLPLSSQWHVVPLNNHNMYRFINLRTCKESLILNHLILHPPMACTRDTMERAEVPRWMKG